MKSQMMIWGCNRSQAECLLLLIQQTAAFQMPYHCNSQTQLRCVIHPSETDCTYRFQSHSLTWSLLLKNLPLGFYQIHIRPARGFLFVCSCFRWNFWAREKTTGILVGGALSQKTRNPIQLLKKVHSIWDKYLLVYAPAMRSGSTVSSSFILHILDVLPH